MTDRPAPPRALVALDIETVSLHPGAEVWEFGAVRREEDGSHRTLSMMLEEPDLRHAERQALDVARFYERHPDAAAMSAPLSRFVPGGPGRPVSRREFARRIALFTHDAVVLVNNPAFDLPRVERILRHQGLVPGWFYRPVDVVGVAAGRVVALHPELEEVHGPAAGWGSSLVSQLLDVRMPSDEERHTALGDARWALRLYDAAVGKANPAEGRAAA